jgi:hypothetical protein
MRDLFDARCFVQKAELNLDTIAGSRLLFTELCEDQFSSQNENRSPRRKKTARKNSVLNAL